MQERHGDLQDVMNVGNSGKILHLTSMLSNVAEKMAEMRRSDNDTCTEEWRSRNRNGLRWVRIGEASHPGDGFFFGVQKLFVGTPKVQNVFFGIQKIVLDIFGGLKGFIN